LLAAGEWIGGGLCGKAEHVGAQACGAVGDAQAHEIRATGAREFRIDLDAAVNLLLGLGQADEIRRGLDLRKQRKLALEITVGDFFGLHGRDITVRLERTVRHHAADVFQEDACAVRLRVVGGRNIADPTALHRAPIGGRAFDGNAEELALGHGRNLVDAAQGKDGAILDTARHASNAIARYHRPGTAVQAIASNARG
jgi:hypothetical protein